MQAATRQASQPCVNSRAPACALLAHRAPAACPRPLQQQASPCAQLGLQFRIGRWELFGHVLGRQRRQPSLRPSAFGDGGSSSNGSPKDAWDDYIEVKVDSVRVSSGASVVFLRLVGNPGLVLPVHIGGWAAGLVPAAMYQQASALSHAASWVTSLHTGTRNRVASRLVSRSVCKICVETLVSASKRRCHWPCRRGRELSAAQGDQQAEGNPPAHA